MPITSASGGIEPTGMPSALARLSVDESVAAASEPSSLLPPHDAESAAARAIATWPDDAACRHGMVNLKPRAHTCPCNHLRSPVVYMTLHPFLLDGNPVADFPLPRTWGAARAQPDL